MEQKYGRQGSQEVVVMGVDDYPTESGHKYSFGRHPGMPWARYDELGRRITEPDTDTKNAEPEPREEDSR